MMCGGNLEGNLTDPYVFFNALNKSLELYAIKPKSIIVSKWCWVKIYWDEWGLLTAVTMYKSTVSRWD